MSTQKLFDDIAQFITESRMHLKNNAMMALTGLDEEVASLCGQIIKMPQAERVRYADKLQYLLNELQSLSEELQSQRDLIGEEIKSVVDHKKASVAYRIAGGKTPEEKDENE